MAEFPIDPVFLDRWSTMSFSGEPMTREEIMLLFEAARWAPSARNSQPWRFVFAMRDTVFWEQFLEFLNEEERIWANKASALVLVLSRIIHDNGEYSQTHSFDTGAAWMSFALQAEMLGYATHAIERFDTQSARAELDISEEYELVVFIAVGRPGEKERLPESLQEREIPSGRISVSEFVSEGKFSPDGLEESD